MAAATSALRLPVGPLRQFQLHQQILRNPPSAIALQLALRHHKISSHVAISVRDQCLEQRRFQSTTGKPGNRNPKRPGDKGSEPPPPPESITRVLMRALYASFRSLGAPFRIETMRKLYRQNPMELVIALGM